MAVGGRETWLVAEKRLGMVWRWDWCLECTWGGLERTKQVGVGPGVKGTCMGKRNPTMVTRRHEEDGFT